MEDRNETAVMCFWTNFLTKNYNEPRNRSLLWSQLLPSVFPGAPAGTPRHVLEKKFTRIRDLRNRLAHHEAVWKFQEEDPVTGAPDYNRPVYGLQASRQLLRRAWKDMLEALSWLSPARHAAFLAEGHHLRFEALATQDGLLSFTGRAQLMHDLNVRRSKEIKKLLRVRPTKHHLPDQPYPDHCHYWSRFYPDPLTSPLPCGRVFFTKP